MIAPKSKLCFTKPTAYEKGNQKITPVKGKTNKCFIKQNIVRHGQNTTNKHFNFSKQSDYKQLKLTKMKKQLFLLVLILAFFAGISNVNAQCTPDALHPAVGVEYDYTATISGDGYDGTGGSEYDWYVTQNLNVILAADIIPAANIYFTINVGTPYHNAATGVNHILLTWTADALASPDPFYLVLRYRETNSTATPACGSENIRVWEIKPINTFLLALEGGMLSGGTPNNYVATPNSFTCAADVTGAVVTTGTPSTVLLTYGENTLYYVATASGYAGEWRPSIRIPVLLATQTYVDVQWTEDMTGTGGWVDMGAATTGAAQDLITPANETATSSVAGTPILIRVRLLNNNWQTLADQTITLGVDGHLPPAFTASDIIGGSGTDACDPLPAFGRTADFDIKARPTIGGTPVFLNNTNP